ncbi:thiamine biosynthesis protein ThiS [Candidatus Caldarchaeum subterraneum]|uniref:Thiamine biosynthesis protein ThiS n=1 Tax=Caldiarchaeum subterraneum TaxID=311458 RepID=E6N706_CALS0|nr:thiamine biosynthesis protein ThiS [Candidatus Caldarchaeum subterraneum]BAJ50865.1 thiamine biosynthesis protein ThiS [Candidatus Caldarchaeum subterraneum]
MSEAGTVKINGRDMVCVGKTISQVLVSVGVDPARQGIAVAVNGEVVPRSMWGRVRLKAGDIVEIVTAVAGG